MNLSLERIIGLYCLIGASIYIGAALRRRQLLTDAAPPLATVVTAVLVLAGLALQLHFPSLLGRMERNPVGLAMGEYWRILTPLFFQDGGISGGVFNLMALALVGSTAERQWGYARWSVIYFGCGVLGECLALAWQPIGAGNSIATMSLSGSLLSLGWRTPGIAAGRPLAALGAIIGLGLIAKQDIHGTAVLLGMAVGALLAPLVKSAR
jgi:membrane associated rhomboid family serine protease